MVPSEAGGAALDTFVAVGPPTAELEPGWPNPPTPRVLETMEVNVTAKNLSHVEENQHVFTLQALALRGVDGVSLSASTQSSPTEREKVGEAPQITISIKTRPTGNGRLTGRRIRVLEILVGPRFVEGTCLDGLCALAAILPQQQ